MSIFTIFPYPKEDEEKLTRKECPHCLKKLDEKPVERVPENPTLNERIWGRWRQSGPYTSRQITCMGVSMGVAAGGFWIFYGFIILAIIAPPGATSSSEHPGSLLEQAKILRAVPAVLISALIPSFPLIYASLLLPCTSRKTAFGLFVFAQFLVLIIVPILVVTQLKSELPPYEKQFCVQTVNHLSSGASRVTNHLSALFANHTNAQPILSQCAQKDFISHTNDSLIFSTFHTKWKLYEMCDRVLKSKFEILTDL